MAISRRSFSNSTSATLTKPAGVVAGDVLVASVLAAHSADATLTGFTVVTRSDYSGAYRQTLLIRVADGSEGASFTAAGGTIYGCSCAAYTGVDTTTPQDATATAATGATTAAVNIPSITTVTAEAVLVIGAGGVASGGTSADGFTVSGSMLEFVDAAGAAAIIRVGQAQEEQLVAGASGTRTVTLATTGGTPVVMASMLALRPAATTPAATSTVTRRSYSVNTGGSRVVSKPAGTIAGDVLIAMLTAVDTVPATLTGFTQLATSTIAGTYTATLLYRVADGTEGATFTPGGTNVNGILMLCYSGADLTTPYEGTPVVTQHPSGLTPSLPGVTTTTDGCRLIAGASGVTTVSGSWAFSGGALTEFVDTDAFSSAWRVAAADEAIAAGATGSRTATMTSGGGGSNTFGFMIALKPAGSYSNPTVLHFPLRANLTGTVRGGITTATATGPVRYTSDGYYAEVATTNLLTNPSAETNVLNATATAGGSVTRDTSFARSGSASFKVTTPGSVVQEGVTHNVSALAYTGSARTFTGSVYVRGTGTFLVWTRATYNDATILDSTHTVVALTSDWQRVTPASITINAAKTVTMLQVHVRSQSTIATTFWTDDAQIEEKAYATSYCDGSLGTGYSWSGTAHGSSSTRAESQLTFDPSPYIDEDEGEIHMRVTYNATAAIVSYGYMHVNSTHSRLYLLRTISSSKLAIGLGSSGSGGAETGTTALGTRVAQGLSWLANAALHYKNLVQVGSTTPATAMTAVPTTGYLGGNSNNQPNGEIADFLVFDRRLTDVERKRLLRQRRWSFNAVKRGGNAARQLLF